MPSSTMKTATHAAFTQFSSEPQRSSIPSYVWRPRTTALTAIVATTTTVNGFESTTRAREFRCDATREFWRDRRRPRLGLDSVP